MVAEQGGRYSQGWGKESKSVTIPAECMKGKTFEQIKAECQKAKKLWEDPDFPANDATINPHEKPRKPLTWKRPPVNDIYYLTAYQLLYIYITTLVNCI